MWVEVDEKAYRIFLKAMRKAADYLTSGKDDMANVTDFRPRRVVQGWPKQGKDDMSNIRLVAGKGEPQGDKRVNVWIEQPEVMPRWPINELRIMTQVDGVGSPRCIGTIEPSKHGIHFEYDTATVKTYSRDTRNYVMVDVDV